jgi:hypothetical protein
MWREPNIDFIIETVGARQSANDYDFVTMKKRAGRTSAALEQLARLPGLGLSLAAKATGKQRIACPNSPSTGRVQDSQKTSGLCQNPGSSLSLSHIT